MLSPGVRALYVTQLAASGWLALRSAPYGDVRRRDGSEPLGARELA